MRALVFALSITAIHAGSIYSVTDLSSLGGSSAVAFGINASGMAVRWPENAIGNTGAFASVRGLPHLPGLSGASDSFAYGVNAFLLVLNSPSVDATVTQPVSTIRNGEQ